MKKFKYLTILLTAIVLGATTIAYGKAGAAQGMRNVEALLGQGNYEVVTENISYYQGTTGFLAKPTQAGTYPGIVMVHEFWGLNDNIKAMAEELAKSGYTVLAVDLYGEVTNDPNKARELVGSVNQEEATRNMRAAVNYLRNTQNVSKIGSLGWCFGGGQSLSLALSGEPMDATVIYYGRLTSDRNELAKINWPVLGVFGARDQSIPVQSVNDFDRALDELGIMNEIYVYEGVGHAFANPSGDNYAPEQTKDAWNKTLSFLERNLK